MQLFSEWTQQKRIFFSLFGFVSGFHHTLPTIQKACVAKPFFMSPGLSGMCGPDCLGLVTHKLFPRVILLESDVADVMLQEAQPRRLRGCETR